MSDSSQRRLANSRSSTSRGRPGPEHFDDLIADVTFARNMRLVDGLDGPKAPFLPDWPRVGDFEVRGWVGEGGFGSVFIGYDPALDRRVALKLCPGVSEKAEAAFWREIQLLAKCSHPNIVTVYEVGRYGDDFYFAMELVEGDGVTFLRKRKRRAEIVAAYCLAGEGLAAAHEEGVVHGDFKPTNVLIDDDDRVRVADFGLARLVDDAQEAAEPGSGSYRAGTLDYMAPELLRGGAGTPQSDQWAFCVALWQSLFYQLPFEAKDAKAMLAAIERGPRRVMLVPGPSRDVLTVLRRGLSIDPGDRYPNMAALVLDLRAAMALVPKPAPPLRRRVLGAAMLVVVSVGTGVAWERQRHASETVLVRPASPCALVDPGEPEVPVVVSGDLLTVCELIRDREYSRAHDHWNTTFDKREMKATSDAEKRRLGEHTLIVARTFIDQAERETDASAVVYAARSAKWWKRYAGIFLGPERVEAVSNRIEPITHDDE